jgi:hypothetical protein
MSSEIEWQNIDERFPVEGRDNPSQGFRDNFSAIKNGLAIASNEISDLQSSTVKYEPYNTTNLVGVNSDYIKTRVLLSDVGLGQTLDNNRIFVAGDNSEGNYYKFRLTEPFITVNFDHWPKNMYIKIRVEFISDGSPNTVKLQTIPNNSGIIRYKCNSPEFQLDPPTLTMATTAGVSKVVDVWSTDGGSTMYLDFVGEFKEVI